MADLNFGNVDHFYSNYYDLVLRSGFTGAAQNRTHRALEKHWNSLDMFDQVLEVGAGAGDHRQFVRHQYKRYYETDIRLPRGARPTSLNSGESLVKEYADFTNLHYEDAKFDRVIATCLLLHLEKPELALNEARRVTKDSGVISILVPCEPGILLRLSRSLLTARKARRLGFEGYYLFNARDHVSYFTRIDRLIRTVFEKDEIRVSRFPFGLPSWNFNFYYVFTIYRSSDEKYPLNA
jgi:phosphatidylethanolamine/phosphatidyl-N-methylethanolamine N-methyltransferase